jgi:hypothetical protein
MDKNVNSTEEQLDWVGLPTPTHIQLTPEPVFVFGGNTLLCGVTRAGKTTLADLSDAFHPRQLSGSDQEGV